MILRALASLAAFLIGWTVYMIAVVLTVYDGLLSMVLQPIMGVLVSGAFVGASLLLGLVLRIAPIARVWTGSVLWAAALAGASLFLLAFGHSLGLTRVAVHPETGDELVLLHPALALGAYAALIFAVSNWPFGRRAPHAALNL